MWVVKETALRNLVTASHLQRCHPSWATTLFSHLGYCNRSLCGLLLAPSLLSRSFSARQPQWSFLKYNSGHIILLFKTLQGLLVLLRAKSRSSCETLHDLALTSPTLCLYPTTILLLLQSHWPSCTTNTPNKLPSQGIYLQSRFPRPSTLLPCNNMQESLPHFIQMFAVTWEACPVHVKYW